MTKVLIETGPRWTWASSLDHPGWTRRGKTEDAALEELLSYADRYAQVVPGFTPGKVTVVATIEGPAMNDWAPSVPGPGEDKPPTKGQLEALQATPIGYGS